ncbi:MAG TPA: molybdopterin cofactor-binding domain-containing protein, partial [Gemmatimonadales bacterium]|nr:molybdopterin cofactor-binding domain-containing protein [Gemmatimonadales bacterium]
MTMIAKLHRRDFIKLGAAAGGSLLLAVYFPTRGRVEMASDTDWQPSAFLRVDPDGTVTVWVGRTDMGQGVRTALPMIVADELDADWQRVQVVQADADPGKYGRMMTVGSTSIRRDAWMPLRQAGAAARQMLVAAAAARWGVSAASCRTEESTVIHRDSNRRAAYGDLVGEAARLPVPDDPRLKQPSEFRLIGRDIPQLDTPHKVTGKAAFGMDIRRPGMVFATVVHCPVFGGSLRSVDDQAARLVPGVRDVVRISRGIAVIADGTWAAFTGADALQITWDESGFTLNSDDISASMSRLMSSDAMVARQVGDADAA